MREKHLFSCTVSPIDPPVSIRYMTAYGDSLANNNSSPNGRVRTAILDYHLGRAQVFSLTNHFHALPQRARYVPLLILERARGALFRILLSKALYAAR